MMRRLIHVFWIVVLLAMAVPLPARQVTTTNLDDRMLRLTSQLRCLVCQNETLADSKADLAVSLRAEIREMMQQGASDQQVVDFLVARYGDFVLYRPPVKRITWLLWFGPALLLAIAGVLAIVILRRSRRITDISFNTTERDRLARLLRHTGEHEPL